MHDPLYTVRATEPPPTRRRRAVHRTHSRREAISAAARFTARNYTDVRICADPPEYGAPYGGCTPAEEAL